MRGLVTLGAPLRMGGGGLLPFSDTFDRADGDLGNGWSYTDGVWTISGNALIATPGTGTNLLDNPGFETGNPPDNWSAFGGSTLSQVTDARPGSSGTKAINAVRGTSEYGALQFKTSTGWFLARMWIKNVDATQAGIYCRDMGVFSASADWWQAVVTQYYAGATGPILALKGAAGVQGRADDAEFYMLTFKDMFALRDFGNADVRAAVDLTMPSNVNAGVGLALCVDNPDNPQSFLLAYSSGFHWFIEKWVSGTRTELLKSYRGNYSPHDCQIGFEKAGQIIRLFSDGGQAFADIVVSDAEIINNTYHGIFSSTPNTTLENFTIQVQAPLLMDDSQTKVFEVVTAAADLWSTSGSHDWLGRSVLLDDGDKWIVIYKAGLYHQPEATGVFHIRFSEDEGATWTAEDTWTDGSTPVTNAPFGRHGSNTGPSDAIIMQAPNGDLLIHVYEHTSIGTYQWRSTDGGATWTDDGLLDDGSVIWVGGQDWVAIGSDLYATIMIIDDGAQGAGVIKSSDNGATWSLLTTLTADTGGESGIANPSGNALVVVMRNDFETNTTYQYTSTDLGQTWSARRKIDEMRAFKRPRLHAFGGDLIAVGRDELGTYDRTVAWYSPDEGQNWGRKFYPDSYELYTDTGYCDILRRANGDFYMQTYGGSMDAAKIRACVFKISAG